MPGDPLSEFFKNQFDDKPKPQDRPNRFDYPTDLDDSKPERKPASEKAQEAFSKMIEEEYDKTKEYPIFPSGVIRYQEVYPTPSELFVASSRIQEWKWEGNGDEDQIYRTRDYYSYPTEESVELHRHRRLDIKSHTNDPKGHWNEIKLEAEDDLGVNIEITHEKKQWGKENGILIESKGRRLHAVYDDNGSIKTLSFRDGNRSDGAMPSQYILPLIRQKTKRTFKDEHGGTDTVYGSDGENIYLELKKDGEDAGRITIPAKFSSWSVFSRLLEPETLEDPLRAPTQLDDSWRNANLLKETGVTWYEVSSLRPS